MSFVAPNNQLFYELSMGGRWNTFGFQFICLMVLVLCSCLRSCSSLNSEGIDLLKFREGIYYDPYDVLASWNSDGHDPCVWSRVHCLDGEVQTLDLSGLSLQGTLAPQLGNLKDLRALTLRGNQFSGPIPREFGSLAKLELLDLSENSLNGDIPTEITRMASLKYMFLCGNKFAETNLQSIEEHNSLLELQFDSVLDSSTARARCVHRRFNHRSAVSNSQDQNLQTSYDTTAWQSVASRLGSYKRRRLLDQSSNLEARPPVLDRPLSTQIVSTPIFRGSGSFPAATNPTPAPAPAPTRPYLKATSPAPAPYRPSVSLPSKGVPQSKPSDKRWIYVSVAIGTALLIGIAMVMFYMARKRVVTTIRPWKTGISGQLQKAFVTGVPKLNRSELEGACEDFSNIIETRDGCTIYKGTLSSGVEIAVASAVIASEKDWSEEAEFSYRRSIENLSRVNHKNFVNLIGYCEENEPFSRMMVYEYAPNGTLFEHLHVKELEHLDWTARMRISMGVAYCLQHMHDLYPPVLHSYLSSNVIYLTDDYAAKIAERIFTKLPVPEEVISRADGEKLQDYLPTCCPESNVHNFGVLLLEIITGKVPKSEEHGFLLEWATEFLSNKCNFCSLVDPTLKSFKQEELEIVCELIKDCIKAEPRQRPTIREVTDRLREVLRITPEAAVPRLSPLWWAELEILSVEAA